MRSMCALPVVAGILATRPALAQPNLPPPPPPPIDTAPEVSPPPAPPSGSGSTGSPGSPASAAPRRAVPARSQSPPMPTSRPPARHPSRVTVTASAERPRPMALTFNPLPLAFGRLSGNFEVRVAAHHAIVASANLVFPTSSRGGSGSALAEGFGFTTTSSAGAGAEVGYHYWWEAQSALSGVFLGPSLLVGATTQASVGDGSHAQPYAGLALDVGYEYVALGGFTMGAGAGLAGLRMADSTAVFPRLLAQLGWSF